MDRENILSLMNSDCEKGVAALIESYSGLVYKIISHRSGGFLSHGDIEEAVSDVFYEIYVNREKINTQKGSLTSFVITVAQRRAVDIFRKKKAAVFSEVSFEDFSNADRICGAEDNVLKAQERSFLISAIVSLGEPDSDIIFRRYYLGEKYGEIAEALGMSENAVGKRLKKSLERLSVFMKGVGFNE